MRRRRRNARSEEKETAIDSATMRARFDVGGTPASSSAATGEGRPPRRDGVGVPDRCRCRKGRHGGCAAAGAEDYGEDGKDCPSRWGAGRGEAHDAADTDMVQAWCKVANFLGFCGLWFAGCELRARATGL